MAMAELERLSLADLSNLTVETLESPMHQAALGVLEGASLLDAGGRLRIGEIRARIASRLHRAPELRRVLHRTGWLEGLPLWVDDPAFDIAWHVTAERLPPPGGEQAAMAFAGGRLAELMDRSRPLWRMWFLEGYGADQVGVLIKVHHALADGRAMLNVIAQLFDLAPDADAGIAPAWSPRPAPSRRVLMRDNLVRRRAAFGRAFGRLLHPTAVARSLGVTLRGAITTAWRGRGAPRTSLNRPVGAGRGVAVLRLPMAGVKDVARASGAKVNDVFLAVVAGGFRRVLLARGERVAGMRLRTSMAVSLHPSADAATAGNLAGTMIVRLPLDEPDATANLVAITRECTQAKARQRAVVSVGLMLFLARTRLTHVYTRRQHMVNVLTTNLAGPPVPLYFAGARLVDAIAMPPIAGNVTVSMAALSYAGTLVASATVDTRAWPDLPVLIEGMRSTWAALSSALPSVPAGEGRTALSA